MELGDLEGLADWAYRAAGLDPDTPVAPIELARLLLGTGQAVPVDVCPGLRTPAALARVGASWRLYVRSRARGTDLRWLTAHELAEWILRRDGCRSERVELLSDALAARLIAPRRAAARALRAGLDFPGLALAFDVTQSCAVLRQGEVSGTPTALVTPQLVYLRGDDYGWPGEPGLRELAARRGSVPGLRKARLRDDRRRVAMRAQAVCPL
jgi:hypothetical protein